MTPKQSRARARMPPVSSLAQAELGEYHPEQKIAEVLSDKDSQWVPLREAVDHNLQLENCYEGLAALTTRCGYINKKLNLKAKEIILSLRTKLEASQAKQREAALRRREIDAEVEVLSSDLVTDKELEEMLDPVREAIAELEKKKVCLFVS